MKISFIPDNPKREFSTIRAKLTYSGVRYTFPVGETVKMSNWKNQRCKSSPEAAAINNKIEAIEAACKNSILYFKQDFKIPTLQEFRRKTEQFLSGNNEIEIKRKDKLLIPYIENYISACTKMLITKRGYTTILNKLKEYETFKRAEFTFSDITLKFAEDLKKWLIQQGYSRNYIGAHFKQIKVFMKQAGEVDRLHDNNDYRRFKVEAETADTIYLTEEELKQLYRLVIDEKLIHDNYKDNRQHNVQAKIESLKAIRNKFLIGCFTALRVSDFNRIQDYNITGGVIYIMPKKGSTIRKPDPVKIPMHAVITEILNAGFDLNYKISEQKINKHIKELCRLAGINQKVITYRTEGGEVKEYVREKWEVVTTHTARRSGATNMYKARPVIPRKSIMLLTGHKTEAQFEKYIKLSAEENAAALMDHNYFKGDLSLSDQIEQSLQNFRNGIAPD